MLSSSEKRFVKEWQDQRKGGRWSYYLLFIPVGTFICSLILSIFLYLFFQVVFGSAFLYWVFLGGFTFSILLTLSSWSRNETRLKKIIRREVKEGIEKDEAI